MERVIAVIPARYASQRLPAKPLVDLLGKPMIQRVYERVRKASLPTSVIVATDDERIADVVRKFGGEVMMTSPDIKSGSDRVAAVARELPGEIFVNVQGDEPLIAPAMIDEAARVLLDDPAVMVGTLVRKIESVDDLANTAVVKVVVSAGNDALYFSRTAIPFLRDVPDQSQWLKHHTFFKHVGMYVFRKDFLLRYASMPESSLEKAERLEQLRILERGYRIKVGITEHDSVPIDTPDDVRRVIELLRAQQ
ncbi:MAG: 3-deoxy-manno-octulosonate cytidylyltransferase [Ignavibacteriales bacterium]|nr:3-deoxy-manno-octulosonate cytidylyltransferase [Ignavibacteriales bacterium]